MVLTTKHITKPWREIVYPSGKTISQVNRYKHKGNIDMYEKASFVFWITLILYIVTLMTVSYVGVYLTYIVIPLIATSGLIMKFSEPNQQSKEIINTTKSTLKTVGNATNTFLNETNSFLDEINSSLEKTNLIHKKTRPLKDKIHKLEMKKLDDELNNNTITEDITNEISTLKSQIRDIEKQHSL